MQIYYFVFADGVYGDSIGQVAVITRFNYTLFNEAVTLSNRERHCKIAFAGVCMSTAMY